MNKQLIPQTDFEEISTLIKKAKQKVFKSVNTTLIDLYREVGRYISNKIAYSEWGSCCKSVSRILIKDKLET